MIKTNTWDIHPVESSMPWMLYGLMLYELEPTDESARAIATIHEVSGVL